MVSKRLEEGDLFPRGAAPDATPRIRKRNGEVLFGPEKKRPRESRNLAEASSIPENVPVARTGIALTYKRITPGMTILAQVKSVSPDAIEFILPCGMRGVSVDKTLLQPVQRNGNRPAMDILPADADDSDDDHNGNDNPGDQSSDSESDEDELHQTDTSEALWKLIKPGQVFPVTITEREVNHKHRVHAAVSLKPELVNAGLNPAQLLTKHFPTYAVVRSVEDHGYILSFGSSIPNPGFLPFTRAPPSKIASNKNKTANGDGEEGESEEAVGNQNLAIGTPLCVLTTKKVSRKKKLSAASAAINVTAHPSDVLPAALEVLESAKIQDLRAGMLLRARVMTVGPAAISLISLGVFPVTVDTRHVPRKADGSLEIGAGMNVSVRVLYVDATSKTIVGTLLPSFVKSMTPPPIPSSLKPGTLLNHLVVESVRANFGLTLCQRKDREDDMEVESDEAENETKDSKKSAEETDTDDSPLLPPGSVYIFSHITHVTDGKKPVLEATFEPGSKIESGGRVIFVSKFDGLVSVDLRPSTLSRKVVSMDEIEPGELYDCKVVSQNKYGGLMVAIEGDPHLPGEITPEDLSDVTIPVGRLGKHASFRVGATLTCRALTIKRVSGRPKARLSSKASLVSPKFPLITSLEDIVAHLDKNRRHTTESVSKNAFTGSVSGLTQKGGLIVKFCNGVSGLVPQKELCSSSSAENIEDLYPEGQTVHVRVISVDEERQRLRLSMNLAGRSGKSEQNALISTGQEVTGYIVRSNHAANCFEVKVKPVSQALEQSDEVKDSDDFINCHLPFGHLSDCVKLSERLVSEIQKDLRTSSKSKAEKLVGPLSLLVLKTAGGTTPMLTCKPSLISASKNGELPSNYAELKSYSKNESDSGRVIRGYVTAVTKNYILIGFLNKLAGVAPKANIVDQFVEDCSRVVELHQSVPCIVDRTDDTQKKFTLNLRSSAVGTEYLQTDIKSFFPSLRAWQHALKRSPIEKSFPVGTSTKATVTSEQEYGTVYALQQGTDKATGVVVNIDHANSNITLKGGKTLRNMKEDTANEEKSVAEGSHEVRVIDVDPFTGVVDLTRNEDVIKGGKDRKFSPGNTYQGEVLLSKDSYLVLAVRSKKGKVSVAFTLNAAISSSLSIKPGTAVTCVALDRDIDSQRNLVFVDWKSHGKHTGKLQLPKKGQQTVIQLRSMVNQDKTTVVGMEVSGIITKRQPLFSFFGIGDGCVGNVHIFNSAFLDQKELRKIPCGVAPQEIQEKFSLPDVGENKTFFVLNVSKTEKNGAELLKVDGCLDKRTCEIDQFEENSKVIGVVEHLSGMFDDDKQPGMTSHPYTHVRIGHEKRISCRDVDCLTGGSETHPVIGSMVVCRILKIGDDDRQRLIGALSDNGLDRKRPFYAVVSKVSPGRGLFVTLPWLAREGEENHSGFVDICDISDDYDNVEEIISNTKRGDRVLVRRLKTQSTINVEADSVPLMMRSGSSTKDKPLRPEDVKKLTSGTPIRGFVRGVSKAGCFVNIGRGISALVKLCDLDDDFVNKPEESFPLGKLVSGKIETVKEVDGKTKASMTLRKRPRKGLLGHHNLKEGSVCRGIVKKIDRWGCIVAISKDVYGLLHTSEADQDRAVDNPWEEWTVGQQLTVVAIHVKDKLSFGTKRCYFEASGLKEDAIDEIMFKNSEAKSNIPEQSDPNIPIILDVDEGNSFEPENGVIQIESEDDEIDKAKSDGNTNQEAIIVDDDNDSEDGEDEVIVVDKPVPTLQVPQEFEFAENSKPVEIVEEDEVVEVKETKTEEVKKSSKDKREKKRLRDAAEKEIQLREEALARDDEAPETAEDYERMLIGEPNSSVLWIQYMAFCLGISQVERARSIAERALETINLEKEVDRTNVWVAYINMEARFGGMNDAKGGTSMKEDVKRDAAVFRVFDRGCQRITDVKNFHLQVAAALRDTHKELAIEVLRRATRKFRHSKKVWIAMGQSQFVSGNAKDARRTLDRAIEGTEKRKHVALITKFAQFEYQHGSAERGRTVFESLTGNFPKRVDLWNIYFDMEIGQCKRGEGDEQQTALVRTRRLFERFTALDFSVKKIKFGFKKWQEFEKTYGGDEERKEVKRRAQAWVDKALNNKSVDQSKL